MYPNIYYPIPSKVHFMHPISKVLCVIFSLLMLIGTRIDVTLLYLIFTLLFLILTHVPLQYYLKAILYLLPFYFLMLVCFVKIPFLVILSIIIRVTIFVWYWMVLIFTTPTMEIVYGIQKVFFWLKIFGISSISFSLEVVYMLYFFPQMMIEYERIKKSLWSRRKTKYKMIKNSFHSTLKGFKYFKQSLLLKGYPVKKRTNFRMGSFTIFDQYIILMYILILFLMFKKEFLG